MKKLCHKHLLMKIDLIKHTIDHDTINDTKFWENLVDRLIIRTLDMKIAIPTRAVLVEDEHNYGVTGAANLTTSHISFHVWPNADAPFITMDIYSCQMFDTHDILYALSTALKDAASIGYIHYSHAERGMNCSYNRCEVFGLKY